MAMTRKAVVYWAATGFLVFNMLSGGLAELAQLEGNAEGMRALGYPLYVMTILGIWKVLGSIALLAPRFPRLKEWAHAGIVFNMTGAAISHLVVGDEAWHVWYTASLAIVALVSWALRPESRTIAALVYVKTGAQGFDFTLGRTKYLNVVLEKSRIAGFEVS